LHILETVRAKALKFLQLVAVLKKIYEL